MTTCKNCGHGIIEQMQELLGANKHIKIRLHKGISTGIPVAYKKCDCGCINPEPEVTK